MRAYYWQTPQGALNFISLAFSALPPVNGLSPSPEAFCQSVGLLLVMNQSPRFVSLGRQTFHLLQLGDFFFSTLFHAIAFFIPLALPGVALCWPTRKRPPKRSFLLSVFSPEASRSRCGGPRPRNRHRWDTTRPQHFPSCRRYPRPDRCRKPFRRPRPE